MGESSPFSSRSTKSLACATSSACHSSSSVASGLPYRRFVATVPAKRYGFCGTSPTVLASSSRLDGRHVHAVDEDLAVGGVEQPGDQPEKRRLAAARRPDHGGRLTRPRHQVDGPQHRLLGTRVAEPAAADLQVAVAPQLHDGRGRRHHAAGGVQDLLDALGADLRARHHHEHEGGHHHGHHDLHEVGEERGQITDLHAPAVDPVRTEPHHGDRRQVHDGHDDREHQRQQPAGAQRHLGQIGVRLPEALLLVVVPYEGADHAVAGDLLAQHPVHGVQADLHGAEQRPQPPDDQRHARYRGPAPRRPAPRTAARPGRAPGRCRPRT